MIRNCYIYLLSHIDKIGIKLRKKILYLFEIKFIQKEKYNYIIIRQQLNRNILLAI